MNMQGKHLLITGGAGSFGRAFVEHILEGDYGPESVSVFSRDEQKHHELRHKLARYGARLRFIIGDMRDGERLEQALQGIDIVVHAAAMKHVPSGEQNPYECFQTNVVGAENLVRAARRNRVSKIVALSSDKAVSPSTAYGASKFMMEKILLNADRQDDTQLSVVRYANVFGSGGSVVPLFLSLRDGGVIPITDPEMTRFSITMQEGIDLVLFAINEGWGGEIVVPIAPSYKVGTIAEAVAPEAEHKVIGARAGEKMHEAMFSLTEASFVVRAGKYYIVTPQDGRWSIAEYCDKISAAAPLSEPFEYHSGANSDWMNVQDIRDMLHHLHK